jgi:hypothetical protein
VPDGDRPVGLQARYKRRQSLEPVLGAGRAGFVSHNRRHVDHCLSLTSSTRSHPDYPCRRRRAGQIASQGTGPVHQRSALPQAPPPRDLGHPERASRTSPTTASRAIRSGIRARAKTQVALRDWLPRQPGSSAGGVHGSRLTAGRGQSPCRARSGRPCRRRVSACIHNMIK